MTDINTHAMTSRERLIALMDDLRTGLPALNDEAAAIESLLSKRLEEIRVDRDRKVAASNGRIERMLSEVEAERAAITNAEDDAASRAAAVQKEAAMQREANAKLRKATIDAFEALKG